MQPLAAATAGPASPVLSRRAVLLGTGTVLAALGAVGLVRWRGAGVREPDAPTVAQRTLRFVDRADGGITVIDAEGPGPGRVLGHLHGEQGFVRGTLRGLVRERRRRGIGAEAALSLIARADGRLTLLDPATGQRIDLESFGPTNAAVFARWLQAQPLQETTP